MSSAHRITSLIVCASACAGCSSPGPAAHSTDIAPDSIQRLAWLSGSWAGAHDGGTIEEHWTQSTGGMMVGMSKLVINDRVAFFEFLRIEQNSDGTIDYVAHPKGKPPTRFRLTSVSNDTIVFENPQHDDPTLIRYEWDGTYLLATTEGPRPEGGWKVHAVEMKPARLPRN